MNFTDRFTGLISPNYCIRCRVFLAEQKFICLSCLESLEKVSSYKLAITKNYSLTVHAVGKYDGILKNLVLTKQKFLANNDLAMRHLGCFMAEHANFARLEFDYIVPIPIHWTKRILRGYNQTEILAEEISKKSGKPILNVLKKCAITADQASLNLENRLENLTDAFSIKYKLAKFILDKRILLVDDVMTTGSTLKKVASLLKNAQPAYLEALVGCRVL